MSRHGDECKKRERERGGEDLEERKNNLGREKKKKKKNLHQQVNDGFDLDSVTFQDDMKYKVTGVSEK